MRKKRIGELLVENGLLTPAQLEEALKVQETKSERLGSILIDLGYLTEETFVEFLADMPGTASVDLAHCRLDREILGLVPKEIARRLEVVPIGKLRNLLTVAMVCPLDEAGQKELEHVTGLRVKPVLCSRRAVYRALDQYYDGSKEVVSSGEPEVDIPALEQSLKLRRVAKLVEEIEELPTLPDIVTLLSAVIHDPNSSATDVARVIASDSALSAKILKLANSAAFAFSRKISNIQHAVTLLGLREAYTLALSVSVIDRFTTVDRFDFRAYWNHSFRCATLSKLISSSLRDREIESAFVAGLLHDMGKVVLVMTMRGKHERAVSFPSAAGMTPIEAEEKVLGLTHAEVGYLLGEHWLLPVELTSAIRYHHLPELEPESRGLAAVVFLANTFCKVDSLAPEPGTEFDGRVLELLKQLDLPEGVLRAALQSYGSIADKITLL